MPRLTPLKIGIGYITLLTLTPERLQKLKVQIAKEVLKAESTAEKKKSLHPALGARQRRIEKGD